MSPLRTMLNTTAKVLRAALKLTIVLAEEYQSREQLGLTGGVLR